MAHFWCPWYQSICLWNHLSNFQHVWMCWLSLTQSYSFHICLFSHFSCLQNAFTRHPMAHPSRSDQCLEVSWAMHYDAMTKPVQFLIFDFWFWFWFYGIYVYQAVSHPKLLEDGSLNLKEKWLLICFRLTITDAGSSHFVFVDCG